MGVIGVITHTSRQHMLLISVQTRSLLPIGELLFSGFHVYKGGVGGGGSYLSYRAPPPMDLHGTFSPLSLLSGASSEQLLCD